MKYCSRETGPIAAKKTKAKDKLFTLNGIRAFCVCSIFLVSHYEFSYSGSSCFKCTSLYCDYGWYVLSRPSNSVSLMY